MKESIIENRGYIDDMNKQKKEGIKEAESNHIKIFPDMKIRKNKSGLYSNR